MHMGYMEGNKEDYTEMCGYYECEDCSERFSIKALENLEYRKKLYEEFGL